LLSVRTAFTIANMPTLDAKPKRGYRRADGKLFWQQGMWMSDEAFLAMRRKSDAARALRLKKMAEYKQSQPSVLTRGHQRTDGMIFWGYRYDAPGFEVWMSAEKYELELANNRKQKQLDYKKNTEAYKRRARKREANKRQDIRESKRKRDAFLRKNDIMYTIKGRLRHRTRCALRRYGWKKSKQNESILGCDYEFLIQHLESKFSPGMNWDNRPQWHVDHIVPLSSAATVEELYKLCHYTNLQPLWAKENQLKSNKMPQLEGFSQ